MIDGRHALRRPGPREIRRVLAVVLFLLSAVAVAAPPGQALRAAAERGDAWAMLNLGAAYDHGLAEFGTDPALAVHWYRRAAEAGIAEAQFNLAHCLATGRGAAQDLAAARVWMALAAEQGLADAQYLLGVMLQEGLGGAEDPFLAHLWLYRAAARGHAEARDQLRAPAGDGEIDR